jgi:hypothetical protein
MGSLLWSILGNIMRALLSIVLLILVGCGNRSSECESLVAKIHNNHIRWDGQLLGLHVSHLGDAERRVLRSGAACRPLLFAALADESRFVAAHVLLTEMEGNFPVSATEWNHLRVNLHKDGRIDIPGGQRQKIQGLWTQK